MELSFAIIQQVLISTEFKVWEVLIVLLINKVSGPRVDYFFLNFFVQLCWVGGSHLANTFYSAYSSIYVNQPSSVLFFLHNYVHNIEVFDFRLIYLGWDLGPVDLKLKLIIE